MAWSSCEGYRRWPSLRDIRALRRCPASPLRSKKAIDRLAALRDDHRMITASAARAMVDTDAERWRAVLSRAAGADGRFFYAVRTTGVYCRPTCPSRRPRRENVEFFGTTGQAESA